MPAPTGPRRRGAKAAKPPARSRRTARAAEAPAPLARSEQRPLLERLLSTPHLERALPRLPPETLHRVIQHCGLEDCAGLVALVTPGQLARVFDLDLWKAPRPGKDEELDASRFGVWLQVLMEAGPAIAARKLAGMDADVVIAGLARHVLVFHGAAISAYRTIDGEEITPTRRHGHGPSCEIAGHLVEARRGDSWDAIVELLQSLESEQPEYFHRVMSGCVRLSSSAREVDGLDDLLPAGDQDLLDVTVGREERREKLGYVAPAEARAFLKAARGLDLAGRAAPARSPIASAYFRSLEWAAPADAETASAADAASYASRADDESASAVAAVFDVLMDAGVVTPPARALLEGVPKETPRLARVHAHMRLAADRDAHAGAHRTAELGFLANAMLSGCSLQGRPFTMQEASDAVLAVCNLGLENWPAHWIRRGIRQGSLPDDFLVRHDLVTVFQVGWAVLHRDVGMDAARRLLAFLADLRSGDAHVQDGLNGLRRRLAAAWRAGTPWNARDALEVILMLDMQAWAALGGLLSECPVIPAALGTHARAVSASDFEFISENRQVAAVRDFVNTLPDVLRA